MSKVETVIIYGQRNCPNCDKAKMLGAMQQHQVVYLQLGEDYTIQELRDLAGKPVRTSPQIFLERTDGALEHIGGYEEYRVYAYQR